MDYDRSDGTPSPEFKPVIPQRERGNPNLSFPLQTNNVAPCMSQSKKWNEADFEVRASSIEGAGQGLFSKTRIQPDDTIGYYTGEIINEEEFHHPDRPFSAYVLWVCRSHIIVGEGPKANYTRYINHSDEPNAFLTVSSRWKTARFQASCTIEPGEEIFFDYGEDYWEKDELPEGQ